MELHSYRSDKFQNSYDFPLLEIDPSKYPPNLKRKLQRSHVHSMLDALLTVPDLLYCCYEVTKAARRAWTMLATRNLHVVGRFNSPYSLPPHPSPDSLPFESKAAAKCSSAPWLARAEVASHTVAQISENPSAKSWCFGHNCRSKDSGKAGGGNGNVRRRPFSRD